MKKIIFSIITERLLTVKFMRLLSLSTELHKNLEFETANNILGIRNICKKKLYLGNKSLEGNSRINLVILGTTGNFSSEITIDITLNRIVSRKEPSVKLVINSKAR